MKQQPDHNANKWTVMEGGGGRGAILFEWHHGS